MSNEPQKEIERLARELDELLEPSLPDEVDAAIVFSAAEYNPFIKRLERYRALGPTLRALDESQKTPLESGLDLVIQSAFRARQTMADEVARVPLRKPDAKHSVYYRLAIAKDYIEGHYSENISIEHLAEVACMSAFHFSRLFKSVFEVSPYRHLTVVRLSKASELLRTSTLPIGEIALCVGFENLPVFSDAFRKEYGAPPSKYRSASRLEQ